MLLGFAFAGPATEIAPYPDAPACAEHDPTAFHTLWNAELGCHYDHFHGDNPHELDDVFGTDVYTLMGGEISYPWHTPGENDEAIKHKSYLWLTGRNTECQSRETDGCIKAWRALVHNDLFNVFSLHHSALLEALVCLESEPDDCGYVLVSGHQATGNMFIDGNFSEPALIGDNPPRTPRPQMLHFCHRGNENSATWYPSFFAFMRVGTQIDDMPLHWCPEDGTPTKTNFRRLNGNGSLITPHIISAAVPPRLWATFDPDRIGKLNYHGSIDVMTGELGCGPVGDMCAPFVLENVPLTRQGFQYNGTAHEFDIFFDGQSSEWIQFPGFVP